MPIDRVRLTAAKSGLRCHRKLRLTRPRARTRARPWKTTNSASLAPGLGLGLGPGRRRTPPRPTQGSDSGLAPEDDELCLARPQGSNSGSAPEDDELRLARTRAQTRAQPRKTTNSASPDPGLGHNLDLGRPTRPRPRRSLRLARPRARTDHVTGGAIITPTLFPTFTCRILVKCYQNGVSMPDRKSVV